MENKVQGKKSNQKLCAIGDGFNLIKRKWEMGNGKD